MAEKYSFFNAVMDTEGNYDREYLAEDFAAYFASFIGNGVYAKPASNLKVTAAGGFKVNVAAGKAWVNGYFYENTTAKTFTIDVENTSGQSRYDSIVLRLDLKNRKLTTGWKKGTASVSPTVPVLTQNANVYELRLANIKVVGGSTAITQSNITDRRTSSECGVVTGVVDQIDTDGLFSQYDSEFKAWFKEVQNTLSTDAAGNLYQQIEVERKRIDSIASLKEGSTTGDAELQDIRVGVDGTTYSSAGEAVRSQFNNLDRGYEFIPVTMDMITKDKEIVVGSLKVGDKWGGSSIRAVSIASDSGFAIYQTEVKKGDCFMLSNKHDLTTGMTKADQRVFFFDKDWKYVTSNFVMNIKTSQNLTFVFPQDGYMVVNFWYKSIQSGEFFYIKKPHKNEPFVLYASKAESYVDDAETGEATMKAIMEGRQILVRVPNADGGNYMALYSPVLMYQLPNYLARHLYLFYLNDGVNAQGLPSYNQLKIAVSRDYNQTPLK